MAFGLKNLLSQKRTGTKLITMVASS